MGSTWRDHRNCILQLLPGFGYPPFASFLTHIFAFLKHGYHHITQQGPPRAVRGQLLDCLASTPGWYLGGPQDLNPAIPARIWIPPICPIFDPYFCLPETWLPPYYPARSPPRTPAAIPGLPSLNTWLDLGLSLIHISEPSSLNRSPYAGFSSLQ